MRGVAMSWWRDFIDEWKARRAGRRYVSNDIYRSTRDITGGIGLPSSKGWEQAERGGEAYTRSLKEQRLPPSLHVSARDQVRAGLAMPLAERDIGSYRAPASQRPRDWSVELLGQDQPEKRRRALRRRHR
jgi:hypothetical protein